MRLFKILAAVLLLFTFVSCEDLLEVPDISGQQVQLLAPSDNTLIAQNYITFSWDEVAEATQYHIQVATPNFENATQLVLDNIVVLDSISASPSITKTLVNGDYEWRVTAQNSQFSTDFSKSSFTIDSGN